MTNKFIARKGLISLEDSSISGTNLQATQTTGGTQRVIFSVARLTIPISNDIN